MLCTPQELALMLGQRIKARRLGIGWTQIETAERAGVAYRTWRRLESEGKASIEDLARAAIALRCEQEIATLFPEPAAVSMDDLLARQQHAPRRMRAPSKRRSS